MEEEGRPRAGSGHGMAGPETALAGRGAATSGLEATAGTGQAPAGPIAIVGGRGYLGRELAAWLQRAGRAYWVVGRQPVAMIEAGPHPYRSSVPDLRKALEGADTVVHLATLTTPALGERNRALDVENVAFTVALLEAAAAEGVRHVVFASSGGTVYGDTGGVPATERTPTNPSCSHAVAKLACEHYLRLASGREIAQGTVLRISNPFGGSQISKGEQGVVSALTRQILANRPVTLLGDTVRDYIYIDDVIAAIGKAIDRSLPGFDILNISTGKGTRLSELATLIFEQLGREPAFTIGERRPFDLAYSVLDNRKAREALGWAPLVGVREGLARALPAIGGT